MFNVHALNEVFTNGYNDIYLNIISLIAILCGILIIVTKNPIISILYLIGLFLSISCYLIMLGMNFMGLSYLLVYIGAVSILFLFILMLINVRISELSTDNYNSIGLGIAIAISFNNIFHNILPYNTLLNKTNKQNIIFDIKYLDKLPDHFYDTMDISDSSNLSTEEWNENLWENFHITSLGNVIYSNYSIWLILTSIILLLAMVGCIVITLKPRS